MMVVVVVDSSGGAELGWCRPVVVELWAVKRWLTVVLHRSPVGHDSARDGGVIGQERESGMRK